MGDEARRYAFPPLVNRGVLLGLGPLQLAVLAAGCLVAVGLVRRTSSAAGFALGALALASAVAGACWPVAGRPPVWWLGVGAGWLARRRRGPRWSPAPASGLPGTAPPATAGRHGLAHGIELLAAPEGPGAEPMGVVRDHLAGSWGAVVAVEGRSFALLDGGEKERRLAAWGSLLAAMARPGSPVHRLQWVEEVRPGRSDDLVAYLGDAGVAAQGGPLLDARRGYEALVAGAGPASQSHTCLLLVAVHPRRASGSLRTFGRGSHAVCDLVRREVRLLVGQLRSAGLPGARALGLAELVTELGSLAGGAAPVSRHAWPLATDEAWSALRADGSWHATYWVAEWPRLDVGPDFLTPLLATGGPRRLSMVMAPVEAARAVREAGSAVAADLADEELRRRAGFVASARRQREAAGVLRRQAELADGHAEYRFSAYLTASGPDRAGLDQRCAEIEQAAQQAHLEVRRLYGRQEEAWTWTLPLGRGLA
ncbi:MAG: SCO6880 family protein [Acidimicrobiales bacterium]